MKRLVWRGLDSPRMEIAHVDSFARARGTQIGVAYELRWELDGELLRLSVNDAEREIALGEADFFDMLDSPFFNSLPVARDRLLEFGEGRDYLMRFVRVCCGVTSVRRTGSYSGF